jgi:hypothetical protein
MSDLSHRRRFLERCGLLAAGSAAGLFVPWWLNSASPASAQDAVGHNAEERLKELGLELPPVTKPIATYVPTVQVGNCCSWPATVRKGPTAGPWSEKSEPISIWTKPGRRPGWWGSGCWPSSGTPWAVWTKWSAS